MPEHNAGEFPLLKYLDSLVEHLRKLISLAVKGKDEDSVHDARVATRRLKAATNLLEPAVSGRFRKPFDRVTKSLRRQLGPLRDLDVMQGHLKEFNQPKLRPGTEWFRQRLGDLRDRAIQSAVEKAPPARMLARLGSWWGLRHEITHARERIAELLCQSVHLQLDAFIEQADDLVGQRGGDPHQLRIAGKSLRYTLEMARQHGVRLPASVTGMFKRMQTALGLWHDYVVLTERIMRESVECDLALHDPRLQAQILSLAQLSLRKAESQLKKMASLWQTHGQRLTTTIRQAFPLTKHPGAEIEPQPAANTGNLPLVSEPGAAPAAGA
ncbi:MAG TPA: CHAD domain-containing protein [Tepidisphaeraceae bacterium]|jgi:CHAD domain-containing protein|nr:CHAD domain-containing protein [Tepidisphaeraceae bacterium]